MNCHGGATALAPESPSERSYTALMIPDVPAHHPAGFDIDFGYWFQCECGDRVEVPAIEYDLQCKGEKPYPECSCGRAVDISEAHPALRDLNDIDVLDEQVDQHLWYHTSPYQDWPSTATYLADFAAQLKRSTLPSFEHEKMLTAKASLALHLGTYAAAIENMLRRMHDQPSPGREYWLHQVQVRIRPGDLVPDIHGELAGFFGDVPRQSLYDLGGRVVRYVNVHEAPGSISLAIDPQVIVRVRTIPLSSTTAALAATEAGRRAVDRGAGDLAAAQQLRPDTSGLPPDQVFESTLDICIAEMDGSRVISDEARQFTERFAAQFTKYHDREREIWSTLRTALTDIYLPGVTPQLRERVFSVVPADADPTHFHQAVRELAGLLKEPHTVTRQFESVAWRPTEGPQR